MMNNDVRCCNKTPPVGPASVPNVSEREATRSKNTDRRFTTANSGNDVNRNTLSATASTTSATTTPPPPQPSSSSNSRAVISLTQASTTSSSSIVANREVEILGTIKPCMKSTGDASTPASVAAGSNADAGSSSSSRVAVIRNPYLNTNNHHKTNKKRPFIGGAEQARRDAIMKARGGNRKRPASGATRILRPGELQSMNDLNQEVLPKKLNIFDKFFASLLRTLPLEYYNNNDNSSSSSDHVARAASNAVSSNNNDQQQHQVWTSICKRAGLEDSIPTKPIQSCCNSVSTKSLQHHFDSRACLVLENARAILSQALEKKWKKYNNPRGSSSRNNNNNNMRTNVIPGTITTLTAQYCEQQHSILGSTMVKIIFHKKTPLSYQELYNLRPGSVYEIIARDKTLKSIQSSTLGVVSSSTSKTNIREQIVKQRSFEVLVYNQTLLPSKMEGKA